MDRPTILARQADEYSLRWSNGNWLVAHVSNVTGVLSICSTWGAWAHRWNVLHLPTPSLTTFLAMRPRDTDYFARKLLPPERQSVIDMAATRREMRRDLCALRRRKLIGSDDARDCWYEIQEWDGGELPTGISASAIVRAWTQEWLDLTKHVLPPLLDAVGSGVAR